MQIAQGVLQIGLVVVAALLVCAFARTFGAWVVYGGSKKKTASLFAKIGVIGNAAEQALKDAREMPEGTFGRDTILWTRVSVDRVGSFAGYNAKHVPESIMLISIRGAHPSSTKFGLWMMNRILYYIGRSPSPAAKEIDTATLRIEFMI